MKIFVEIFSFIYTKIFTLEILLHKNYSYEKSGSMVVTNSLIFKIGGKIFGELILES